MYMLVFSTFINMIRGYICLGSRANSFHPLCAMWSHHACNYNIYQHIVYMVLHYIMSLTIWSYTLLHLVLIIDVVFDDVNLLMF